MFIIESIGQEIVFAGQLAIYEKEKKREVSAPLTNRPSSFTKEPTHSAIFVQ